jgi:hypothetical protein
MANAWMKHVMDYKKQHKVTLGEAMKAAKKTYKSGQKGGNCQAQQQGGNCTLNGGRRRRTRAKKSRRSKRS